MSTDKAARKLPVILILSLMANMLLVGILAGQFIAGSKPAPPGTGGPPPPAEARIAAGLLSTLDDADRRQVRRAFGEALSGNRELIRERHLARRHVAETLSQEPFDSETMQAAFARMRAADAALQERIQVALADQMAELSPQQRAALSELLQSRFAGHRRHGRRWRERGPEPAQ